VLMPPHAWEVLLDTSACGISRLSLRRSLQYSCNADTLPAGEAVQTMGSRGNLP